ncbi:mg2+ transporter zinc transport protein, partial [Diplodia corticola]
HISSKFPEYLEGCLLALSDWSGDPARVVASFRKLEHCIYQNERFSKHGRYFSPFLQRLGPEWDDSDEDCSYPMLISVPFLDWTVQGEPPPLRFQIDPREGFQSSSGSSHMLRSILQYFYRLEDTSDRENSQVFSKYKPWTTDRDLDLKVRSLYGHYPCGLNVDEVWILAIDKRHIVTFSSNQSWKSRWPPLQLTSRIAEVSFRGIRNNFFRSEQNPDYTAMTHTVACLSGAVGILHRSFWSDLKLCLVDRYAGYLGHLQYRLHRSPSTRLVMDLLQPRNPLPQTHTHQKPTTPSPRPPSPPPRRRRRQRRRRQPPPPTNDAAPPLLLPPSSSTRATYRQLSTTPSAPAPAPALSSPPSQLRESLARELADLRSLRDNSNALANRTIQLVNIRLEDHGKAILVFTVVTVVFLPLSFVTSFFGMNFADIRDMRQTAQGQTFWVVAASVTVGVVGVAAGLAFWGGEVVEWGMDWREGREAERRRRRRRRRGGAALVPGAGSDAGGFGVSGVDGAGW